mmetsp:Transcript_17020/g.15373  ORF Transcript_17020/g.15373 Transcript_17020/m.15373 type:complete len:482 (+) Transcript_17020:60-1505(+)
MSETSCCSGPGYETPLAAFTSGSIEKLIYVPAVVPDGSRPDYLATVDVDPSSETFSQVIHRLPMPFKGDELHHSGWNACSSCYGDPSASRRYLVLPALKSGNIYSIDVLNAREPTLNTYIKGEDIGNATGLAYPHSSHCLGNGSIMISTTGKADGSHAGNFLLLTSDFKIIGKWSQEDTNFGYDFWYQPKFNTMISTEFGTPNKFIHGFNPADISSDYGSKLHVYNWKERTLRQTIDLGGDGLIPLEIRFAHDPLKSYGFVGAALSSNIIYLDFDPSNEKVNHQVVIKQPWVEVEGWALPTLPPLITDILLSLDDKWLFFSNWLRGDVLVYDVSTPSLPVLADRLFIGGSISKQGSVKVPKASLEALELTDQPNRLRVKGVEIQGGPQMLQLSLDGKRLYVTNSLLSSWDLQFYGDNFKHNGSQLIRLNFNASTGKLSIDEDFLVDFGKEPDGAVLAHECRYPGGDCSSDIWLAPGTTWDS